MADKVLGQTGLDKLIQLMKGALSTKVDKETGKGLSTNDFTTEEKTKLAGLSAPESPDWNESDSSKVSYIANKPTKVSDFTNDSQFQTATQVTDAINSAISGVYTPKGSIAFADLPAAAASNLGYVYNINEAFTTTASFVEGAGARHAAGTNVVCIEHNSGYYWDVLGSAFAFEELTANEVQTLWNGNT